MKTGSSIEGLLDRLIKENEDAQDFNVPMKDFEVTDEMETVTMKGLEKAGIKPLAHQHLNSLIVTKDNKGLMPFGTYERMRAETPALLQGIANDYLHRNSPDLQRMVRTLDGKVRAILSDRYMRIDNLSIARTVLPVLKQLGVIVVSAEVTETRLYIKAIDGRINAQLPSGRKLGDGVHAFHDVVSPAITIGNSEVGQGAAYVETGIYTKVCTNLAMTGTRFRRAHLGQRLDDDVFAMLSDHTKDLNNQAIIGTISDYVKNAFDQKVFEATAMAMGKLVEHEIKDPVKVIDITAKKNRMTEAERAALLNHFTVGGDMTAYGLMNAITRTAQDLPDYDRATEFEKLGGSMIEMPQHEVKLLALAA